MTTTTLSITVPSIQYRNWDLPEDDRTVVIAAMRKHDGDYGTEHVRRDDGTLAERFQVTYGGTTYRSWAVERVDLDTYKVHLNTAREWDRDSEDLSFMAALRRWLGAQLNA